MIDSEGKCMQLLIGYLIVISVIGFASMGIDKQRSMKGRWRISEKTLIWIAVLGGSLGSLLGIYFFRHKTKHRSFTFGIPAILLMQGILVFVLHRFIV